MQIPELKWLKPAVVGVIGGALGWWIVLSAGLGWMSAGAAAHLATKKARAAVVAYATPMCVVRFERQANPVAQWKALKKSANNYNQVSFLKKERNLIADPGQKLGDVTADAIANACSTKLLALKSIGGIKLTKANSASG